MHRIFCICVILHKFYGQKTVSKVRHSDVTLLVKAESQIILFFTLFFSL